MLIAIEGNIGAGKSTLLKRLECETKFCKDHIVMYEPIDEWLNVKPDGEDGPSLFEKYYSDKRRYGFMFQMYALQTRLAHLMKIVKENPDKIIICERTHLTDAEIFAKMLAKDKLIDSYENYVYESWFKHAAVELDGVVKGVVYLRASPPTCMTRIAKRNRDGEDAISVNYIKTLHALHEDWLVTPCVQLPTLVVNGDVEETDVDIASIIGFVNGLVAASDASNPSNAYML